MKMTLAEFMATVDDSVAGSDEHGGLSWHIECSAEANANDMSFMPGSDDWEHWAVETAKMCLDDWRGFYPYLVKGARS